jgi:hypothetical protein
VDGNLFSTLLKLVEIVNQIYELFYLLFLISAQVETADADAVGELKTVL